MKKIVTQLLSCWVLLARISVSYCLLESGKTTSVIYINKTQTEVYYGIHRSAFNQTTIEIKVGCTQATNEKFSIELVVRSSPCDREYAETLGGQDATVASTDIKDSNLLAYFTKPEISLPVLDYNYVWTIRSDVKNVDCQSDKSEKPLFTDLANKEWEHKKVELLNASVPPQKRNANNSADKKRNRRDTHEKNGTVVDEMKDHNNKGRHQTSHPALTTPAHGIYLLIFHIKLLSDVRWPIY